MRVLLATDGSAAAGRATALAATIEWPVGTQLRVVSVFEPTLLSIEATQRTEEDATLDPDPEMTARAALADAVGQLERDGIEVSCRLMQGRPATKVIENARDFAVDLIIVGSRGHGTITSMLLGSVSAEVADHAHCPVLVARRPTLTRLVLGVDGSSYSRTAEDVVATWPVFANVAVEVVNVEQSTAAWSATMGLGGFAPAAALDELIAADDARHRAVCEASAARLRAANRQVAAHVLRGSPASELMRAANDTRADLIVVGTHGRSGLSRAVYGSVARNVMLHAACSVMVVRQVSRPAFEAGASA